MKKGFTLIELMVASLLLAMLTTILTMIFNQSSIAWRTGVAGVVNLNKSRMALGVYHDIRDDLLPGLGDQNPSVGASDNRTLNYRTVSVWDPTRENALRLGKRAFNNDQTINWGVATPITISGARNAQSVSVIGSGSNPSASKGGFSVGVRSLGPDGKPDTPDDINTWPEEID